MTKDVKINMTPQGAHASVQVLDLLLQQICEVTERNAKTIRHGATFMTATREELHVMGGVEALSTFGLNIEGFKQQLITSLNSYVNEEKSVENLQDQHDSTQGDDQKNTNEDGDGSKQEGSH